MSRFEEEVKIIPRPAFAIGLCVWLAFFLLMTLLPMRSDPELRHWPMLGKLAISILPGIPLFFYASMVGYVYGDAKRRGMRYVMWTLLASLVPNAIGIILYFVLREPLLVSCTRCGAQVKPGFAFCPSCGESMALACPQCRCAVESGWTHCARCGAGLRAA
jgi:predicted RNA-binding Zn-ribbon protein involved in translation (DUF1610 family)